MTLTGELPCIKAEDEIESLKPALALALATGSVSLVLSVCLKLQELN